MDKELRTDKFHRSDIKECTQLMIDVYSKEPWLDKWPSFDKATKYLREYVDNPSFIGYVLRYNNNIVAVCFGHKKSWWQGDEYYIDEFFTHTSLQNKGIGTKLMSFVKESLKEENIKCITLLTEREIPAEQFYKKNNFKIKEDNIFMYCNF